MTDKKRTEKPRKDQSADNARKRMLKRKGIAKDQHTPADAYKAMIARHYKDR